MLDDDPDGNPSLSIIHTHIPFYLFQSPVLIALAANLFESRMIYHLKSVPKLAPTNVYPYCEVTGKSSVNRCLRHTN